MDSCSAACHSPALDACSLVPRTAHTNRQSIYYQFIHLMPNCIILQKPLERHYSAEIMLLPEVSETSSRGLAPLTAQALTQYPKNTHFYSGMTMLLHSLHSEPR